MKRPKLTLRKRIGVDIRKRCECCTRMSKSLDHRGWCLECGELFLRVTQSKIGQMIGQALLRFVA